MIAHLPNLNNILRRHEIHRKFWPAIRALVEEGQRPCKELRTRLHHVSNYKAALNEILTELSKPLAHKFPPPDYRSPVSYESLRAKDIHPEVTALATSAGQRSAT